MDCLGKKERGSEAEEDDRIYILKTIAHVCIASYELLWSTAYEQRNRKKWGYVHTYQMYFGAYIGGVP